ncbi:MAG: helix-turn-helix domain-containing protein [Gemmatimonadota bacterium]|nr:helix-turn-helix domain-containing protein [Gemmatimonadota bacterium]
MVEIGRRLRAMRKARRMSQSEAAEQSGVSRKTVHLAEHGENATLLTLIRLLRTYGALGSLNDFIPETELSPLEVLRTSQKKVQSS